MNKRGQELTIGTLILIVLGLVVLVVVAIGFTTGFGFLTNLFKFGVSDMETATQACIQYSEGELYNDYCKIFREVDVLGETQWANCQNAEIVKGVKAESVELKCDVRFVDEASDFATATASGTWYCDILYDQDKLKRGTKANGVKCNEVGKAAAAEKAAAPAAEGTGAGTGAAEGAEREEDAQILALFDPNNPASVRSKEECRKGIEERKNNLEIPERLCYWSEMTNIYSEKCPELDGADINLAFALKRDYRFANNPDWPELNTHGDFCIPIFYDCDQWDKAIEFDSNVEKSAGFHIDSEGKGFSKGVHINPYKNIGKNYIRNTLLLHEGLHSIQGKLYKETHIGEGEEYTAVGQQYDSTRQLLKTLNTQSEVSETAKILRNKKEQIIKDEGWDPVGANFDQFEKFDETLDISSIYVIDPEKLKEPFKARVKNPLVKYGGFDKDVESAYNKILELNEKMFKFRNEFYIKGYIGSKLEIDPRLSEVQRWWLDERKPCEIILTEKKAKEVLDKFLVEKDIDAVYSNTQKELQALIYLYEDTEWKDEIYGSLVKRLPGLAYEDSLDSGDVLA